VPNCWLASASPFFRALILASTRFFAPSERTSFKASIGSTSEEMAQVTGKMVRSVKSLRHRPLAALHLALGDDAD
jgi:hypothetical protein